MKTELEKIEINKLANILTSLNNLKTKIDKLDVGKSKTVPGDLTLMTDNEAVKNTKLNMLKIHLNNWENKIPEATPLIQLNQYSINNQNLEKKNGDVDKKCQIQVVWWMQLFWIQKVVELRTKCQILVVC